MLELRRLNAGYGRAQVLFDVDLRAARRRSGRAARPQRRGQVDRAEGHRWACCRSSPGEICFDGKNINGLRAIPDRPPRPGLRAGGPAHLRRPDGGGKPRGRPAAAARRRAALDAGEAVRAVPEPRPHARSAAAGGMSGGEQQMLDHRAHADGQPARRSCWTSPPRASRRVIVEQMARDDPRTEARGPERAAVRAEPALRRRGRRPRLPHREGPHPLLAGRWRDRPRALSVPMSRIALGDVDRGHRRRRHLHRPARAATRRSGEVRLAKVPTTAANQADGVLAALAAGRSCACASSSSSSTAPPPPPTRCSSASSPGPA